MNNKYIVAAALASVIMTSAALADTAGDTQVVTITVPAVKLLDIKNASGTSTSADEADALSFTLVAPTVAGDNFAAVTHATGGFYDVTSNVASGGSTTRKITVAADALGAGWKLDMTATPVTGASASMITFLSSDVAAKDLVTAIGNVAEKNAAISYTFGPESTTIVPSYTATTQDITLTFTLSDDA